MNNVRIFRTQSEESAVWVIEKQVQFSFKKYLKMPGVKDVFPIICEMRESEVLWNIRHPQFHNTQEKKKILDKISKKHNIPVKRIQGVIKYVKKEFKKEEAKKLTKSGSAPVDLGMHHEWKWYKECQFLRAGKSVNMNTMNTNNFEMTPTNEQQLVNIENELTSDDLPNSPTDSPTPRIPVSPMIFSDLESPSKKNLASHHSLSPMSSIRHHTFIEIMGSPEQQCLTPPPYEISSSPPDKKESPPGPSERKKNFEPKKESYVKAGPSNISEDSNLQSQRKNHNSTADQIPNSRNDTVTMLVDSICNTVGFNLTEMNPSPAELFLLHSDITKFIYLFFNEIRTEEQ